MSMRQIFRKLLKNISPAMPSADKKIQFEPVDLKKLTHEYMIKQSVLHTVNSATQTLTVTYMAITDLSIKYRKLLNKLISLLEETLTYKVSDEHWDLIVKVRNEMHHKKEQLVKLSDSMEHVYNIAISTSHLSYLCEMENLCNTLLERLDDTMSKVKAELNSNKELELTYWRIQGKCINDNKDAFIKSKIFKVVELNCSHISSI
ncbi:uncharacterized protein LOC114943810 isoform X2 [Nylanderia fulva]|uniref:uncharacterized protein LOC114943810 isoform X2 n=1 Tax=Nylanderia fulva TaxID=613905 RepID=UPI0010FB9F60|nr:uncharacterized protein LOC114943810 isoform X2 [Nylanderia fulva]